MRALSIVFVATASLLVASACNPPAPKKPGAAAKRLDKKKKGKKPQKPRKPRPKDAWLDGALAKATVVVEKDGKTEPCKWNASKKRHTCPGQNDWVWVGGHVNKAPGGEVYCAWNHPVDKGVVKTTLPGVAKEKIEFRHLIPGRAATLKHLDPIDVTLKVDGKEVAKLKRERKPGFAGKTLEPVKKGKGDLEIAVSAKRVGAAHYCWQIKRMGETADAPKKTAVAPVPTPGDPPKKLTTDKISPDAKKKAVQRAAKTAAIKAKVKADRLKPVKSAEGATVKEQ